MEEEESKFRITMWLLLCSFGVGLLLTLFAMLHGMFRFVFSLGALYIGFRYFRDQSPLGLRIGFVLLSIFFFVITTAVITAILYSQGKITLPAS